MVVEIRILHSFFLKLVGEIAYLRYGVDFKLVVVVVKNSVEFGMVG
jgi:hypothetical protein